MYLKLASLSFLICLFFANAAIAQQSTVDASTLQGKFMMGYQGWFSAPGDGSALGSPPYNEYSHWTHNRRIPGVVPACDDPAHASPPWSCGRNGNNLTVDMWPDMREMDADEKYPTEFTLPSGAPAYVFSSANQKTVLRHFKWMQDYGIDGVFAMRNMIDNTGRNFEFKKQVLENIRKGAEIYGRVFAIRYAFDKIPPEILFETAKKDWIFLVDEMGLTASPNYLHDKGRPVLAFTSLGGMLNSKDPSRYPCPPDLALQIIRWFTHDAPEKYRVTLVGVVPTHWRTLDGDSQRDPKWAEVYQSYDVIMPWMPGRFNTIESFQKFEQGTVIPDMAFAKAHHQEYMPVVFPGFSWSNEESGPLNKIPRLEGRFLWEQLHEHINNGNHMIFGAMFDEINEGTAFFKTSPNKNTSPVQADLLTLDADGKPVASDWYLCLAGEAANSLHSAETLPSMPPKLFSINYCNRHR